MKKILKKIIKGWANELRQYALEFYSSSSFWSRFLIIIVYFLLVVLFFVFTYFYSLPPSVSRLLWFSGLVYLYLVGHYLSTVQRFVLTALWIIYYGILVGHLTAAMTAAYWYMRIADPPHTDEEKPTDPGFKSSSSDKEDKKHD